MSPEVQPMLRLERSCLKGSSHLKSPHRRAEGARKMRKRRQTKKIKGKIRIQKGKTVKPSNSKRRTMMMMMMMTMGLTIPTTLSVVARMTTTMKMMTCLVAFVVLMIFFRMMTKTRVVRKGLLLPRGVAPSLRSDQHQSVVMVVMRLVLGRVPDYLSWGMSL